MKSAIKSLMYVLLLTGYISCSINKDKESSINRFTTDFEQINCWLNGMPIPSLCEGQGHSGRFYTKVDSSMQYSMGLWSLIKDISNKPIKKVKVILWANFTNTLSDGFLCIGIYKPDNTLFNHNELHLSTTIKQVNTWTEINFEYNFPVEVKPDFVFKAFVSNAGQGEVKIDDLDIIFE